MAGDMDMGISVLARMVRRAPPRGPDPAPLRALWDRAISRAGRAYPGLDPAVGEVEVALAVERDAALDGIAGRGLVAIAEPSSGAKADGQGGLWADGALIDALIEAQTQGEVSVTPGPERKLTRIDVALSRDFLDLVLSAATREGAKAGIAVPSLRFGSDVAGMRGLSLALDGPAYDRLDLRLTLGGAAAREGRLILVLPAMSAARRPSPTRRAGPGLLSVMGAVELLLPALLGQARLPLDRLQGLRVGSEVPLGTVSLDDLWLEDGQGRRILRGRLGKLGPDRAVRLAGTRPQPVSQPAAAAPRREEEDAPAPATQRAAETGAAPA